ncbi:uncharacterized protein V6R79_024947, partial [Siganus canaliculatus]
KSLIIASSSPPGPPIDEGPAPSSSDDVDVRTVSQADCPRRWDRSPVRCLGGRITLFRLAIPLLTPYVAGFLSKTDCKRQQTMA